MKKTKPRPTREDILKGMGWKPLKVPGVPRPVLDAENRRMQDEIVGWVQGLSAHIDKGDAAKARKPAAAVGAKVPGSKKHAAKEK